MRSVHSLPIPAFILLAVFSVVLIQLLTILYPPFDPDTDPRGDQLHYRSMAYNWLTVTRPELNVIPADNPVSFVYDDPYWGQFNHRENALNRQPPFCYRIGAPALARLIGLPFGDDINLGFRALTLGCLAIAILLSAWLAFAVSASLVVSLIAALIYAGNYWLTGYYVTAYMLVDPPAYVLLAVAALALVYRRRKTFFVTCAIGLFFKEALLFMLPCWLLYEWLTGTVDRRSLAYAIAALVPYAMLRLLLPIPVNTYSLTTAFLAPNGGTMLAAVATFGPLWALAALWAGRSRLALSLLPLVAGGLFSALFASNTERSLAVAFPFIIIALFTRQLPQEQPTEDQRQPVVRLDSRH